MVIELVTDLVILNICYKTTECVEQLAGGYSSLTKVLEFESLGIQLRLNNSVRRVLSPLWSCPARIRISQRLCGVQIPDGLAKKKYLL